jgi:hypothetical protein
VLSKKAGTESMMRSRQVEQGVPSDHLPRSIDRFVELSELRRELMPIYTDTQKYCKMATAGRLNTSARDDE